MAYKKTKLIRVYEIDKEILKNSNSSSIADAVHTLIHGSREDMKELISQYMTSEIMPYIAERMKEIENKIKEKELL